MRQAREISKEIETLDAQESEQKAEVNSSNGANDADWDSQAI